MLIPTSLGADDEYVCSSLLDLSQWPTAPAGTKPYDQGPAATVCTAKTADRLAAYQALQVAMRTAAKALEYPERTPTETLGIDVVLYGAALARKTTYRDPGGVLAMLLRVDPNAGAIDTAKMEAAADVLRFLGQYPQVGQAAFAEVTQQAQAQGTSVSAKQEEARAAAQRRRLYAAGAVLGILAVGGITAALIVGKRRT